jgi:arylformamidase
MRIIDISVPLTNGMVTYPGDPPFRRDPALSRAEGDSAEVSLLTCGSHTGTHIDVPVHFIEGGADLSAVALDAFVGPCRVVDVTGRRAVNEADVAAALPRPGERILFKTDNSAAPPRGDFSADYVFLSGAAARALAASGVRLVGWDYLSVEEYDAPEAEAHLALLGAGVMILEGLDLAGVPAGEYFLAALPLAVAGGDGAPARAVLMEDAHGEETP